MTKTKSMDVIQTITARHSVRDWSDRTVPADVITSILDAGRHSPSPLNSQPWHFIVVRKAETIERLMKHAHHGSFLSKADTVIVVTVDQKAKVDEWLFDHEQHLYSGACALYNMWLASVSLGLGSCWVTMDEDKTAEILAIPGNQKVIGSLATGYPKETPVHDVPKKELSEVVSYERY